MMVFRFIVEDTINAVATNKFKAEDAIARISEAWYSSASAKDGPGSRGERNGGCGCGRGCGCDCGHFIVELGDMTDDDFSAHKRLMLTPMTTDEKRREDDKTHSRPWGNVGISRRGGG
jgi:hypothetical protein